MKGAGKPRIMVMIDWFDPAYKAGGPVTSAVNFVQAFSPHAEIWVFTTACDLDGNMVVERKRQSKWLPYNESVQVYYASNESLGYRQIRQMIKDVNPHFVYCSGIFSVRFTIFPLLIKKASKPSWELVLAPRGMLKQSALAYKPVKKKLYLWLIKKLGLMQGIVFQATDPQESKDIQAHFSPEKCYEIGNFPTFNAREPVPISKRPADLRIYFLGRVHPIKGLHKLLSALRHLEASVQLTIIGPIEDAQYWTKCQALIGSLPHNIRVEVKGEQPPRLVSALVSENHILALPTEGENFGHAIFESFSQGRPVVIFSTTPWRDLAAAGVGFDILPEDETAFVAALRFFADADQEVFDLWSSRARQKAKAFVDDSAISEAYKKMFSINASQTRQIQ